MSAEAPTAPTTRRLSIARFRGISALTWWPGGGVNVVLGGGDVGKTTIVDAIGLLLSPVNSSTMWRRCARCRRQSLHLRSASRMCLAFDQTTASMWSSSAGFWQVTLHFGFVQIPDLPSALGLAKKLPSLKSATYFIEREYLVSRRRRNFLARWHLALFSFMSRNSVHAIDRLQMPADSLVELGRRIEL